MTRQDGHMRRSIRLVPVLAFVASVVMAAHPAVRADNDAKEDAKVVLASGYSAKGLLPAKGIVARSLRLTVTLDDQGGGKGTLALDPNLKTFDSFGRAKSSTLMAFETWNVTFEQVEREEKQADGRKAYEIKGHKLDASLYLVTPAKDSTTYRLIVSSDKDRARDVLLLEAKAPPVK